jgi:hypothetical protein
MFLGYQPDCKATHDRHATVLLDRDPTLNRGQQQGTFAVGGTLQEARRHR